MKGQNFSTYPQNPSQLATVLPPALEDIITPICVVFVGAEPPSKEWLRTKAKPLIVRRERVRRALEWLKRNNTLYEDVTIDQTALQRLPEEDVIDVTFTPTGANVTTDVDLQLRKLRMQVGKGRLQPQPCTLAPHIIEQKW